MNISYTTTRYYITVFLITMATLVHANTITVMNTMDTGVGSLRDAVQSATAGDTIRFSTAIDGQSINLVTEISLDKNLVIIGNPAASAGQAPNTIIDGMDNSRIFHIPAGHTVAITGIKMQNGNGGGVQPFASSKTHGGAIYNQGSVTFTNSTISGNSAAEDGGGVSNFGEATFTNTTISGNSADLGGGVNNFNGAATFTNSTISGNSANVEGGGVFNSGGMATFTNSTISGNSTSGSGGGVYNLQGMGTFLQGMATFTNSTISGNTAFEGGGVYNLQGMTTFTNTTISGNSADLGGGVNNFNGAATFTNSTISGNSASTGGGVYNSGGTATFTNTIVAKNSGTGPDINNPYGNVVDGGNNLIGDGTGQTMIVHGTDGNQVGTTAMPIDPLFVMGVPPAPSGGGNLRLQCSSPAIDAGTPDTTGLNVGAVDLLGNHRITGTIDIGAYEQSRIVMNTNDAGPGSLRDIVVNACPGDTITFDESLNGNIINLVTEISLDKNLVIIGNPAASAGQAPMTIIDGMDNSRIFHIPAGDTVSISGIKMQGGNGVGAALSGFGGAILNEGVATLNHSVVSGNTITTPSRNGGGIINLGTLILNNSEVSDNKATLSGGGISSSGIVTLTNSTVSGNDAAANGGGIFNVVPGSVTLTNSILSGNMATSNGGGLYNSSGTVATFTNATISGNQASFGGGMANQSGSATATFTNTIVAKNIATSTGFGVGPDINAALGGVMDGGHNLIGDGSGQSAILNGMNNNQVGPDPMFIIDVPAAPSTGGDLRLACGSPAIDEGDDADNTTAEDINGLPRKVGTIDIGAHERRADMGSKIVTTLADDGPGSLRDMVLIACPEDTITFHASLDMDTIKLVTEITLNKNLVIIGNDTTKTIIDGMDNSRIFHITTGDMVYIDGIKMQNGNGGGVQPFAGSNTYGGAIFNQGMATFTNSTISGNSAFNGGGLYNLQGMATFTNSTISGNSADFGGGVFNLVGMATFTNSTISGNSAFDGGGLYNLQGMATFTNTTISGNSASYGGGVSNSATATFTNTTISGNSALDGGGVDNSGGIATFTNSIVAKNTNVRSGPDIFRDAVFPGMITDGGYNLIGDTTSVGSFFTSSTLLGNTSMPLDPLFVMIVPPGFGATTGGDLRLQCGSPAIDAGKSDTTGLNLGLVDLGDNPRIITKTIDIGAYEFQASDAPAPVTLVTNTNDAGCGSLRFAVCNAMAGDTIRFDASLDMDTIKLVTEITIDTNLIIAGNPSTGSGQVTTGTIIDGMGNSRIFYIPAGDTVVMDGVALRNGNGVGSTLNGFGGAVLNQGNTTITNSTISESMAVSGGGGIYNNNGAMTLTNNTISENSAPFGGGVVNVGAMLLTHNTISANTASMFSGGGVTNAGLMILTNARISGNDAPSGGGVSNDGSLTLINATISGNTATTAGGGVINDGGSLTLTNSIIALNSAVTDPDMQLQDIIIDQGYNLIGDGSGQSDIEDGVNGNIVGTSMDLIDPIFVMNVPAAPSLGGDLRLKSCSPARDAGNDAANTIEDILGNPRIIDVIDIGAYERALGTDSKLVNTLADAGMGSLRYMIEDACPSDTIRFDVSLDMDTFKLTTGEITLDKNLIIIGNDISNTIIDGQSNSRIFQIAQGDTVSIEGLTIQNGNTMSDGGGIFNQGKLTLNDIALMSNTAASRGGGMYNNQFGTAALMDVRISKNSAERGGGIYNKAGDMTFSFGSISDNIAMTQGGGVFNEDEATFSLIQTSLFINAANEGAGFYNTFKSTCTVSNTSIESNTAAGNGGGFYNDITATVDFNMSSFAENKAADGGALFDNGGTTTFMNMNIAGTGDGADTSGVLSITGPTEFKTTTVFSRNE